MNAVQCDYCKAFAPNPTAGGPLIGRYTDQVPDDWYIATASKGKRQGESLATYGEFCSLDCISEHFHEMHRAERSEA